MRTLLDKVNGAVLVAPSLVLAASAFAADSRAPLSDDELVKSAMAAAPAKVAVDAAVVVMEGDGSMRTLRAGTNAFTCMLDNPETPGPDPMCMDRHALEWVHAWVANKAPPPGRVGFMYMLAGGTDASNTDPYATRPEPGNHWIETGPHVMIVGADDDFSSSYPKSTDPDTSSPYVMWPDTAYRHLMVPVR